MSTFTLRRSGTGMILAVFLMLSCKEEERLTISDTQEITEESVTDAYYLDIDDMATVAVSTPSDDQYSGGRVATTVTITDLRFCAGTKVTITPGANSTFSEPNGTMTVDFGAGCTDLHGNTRAGKLIFTYNKWRFTPGSTIVATTDNYVVNGIKLEGKRTLTNVNLSAEETSPKFHALLEDGKATFLDGSTAVRESDITWQWTRTDSPADDFLTILATSNANGTTRKGAEYEVDVYEALIYKRNCGIAVSGIKKYFLDTKEITIDYGSGDCDRSVVVTVNGTSRSFTISEN